MRKRNSAILITIIIIAGLVLANFVIQVSAEPGYNNMGTDSGTFAYCGQVIHNGGLMYRDCWDNKPPAVYYLNAAAISLGGSNPYAIWLFQAIWLTLAVIIFFLVLILVWDHLGLAAFGAFALLFIVLYPDIFQGGNFTETYALLPVVLALGALWGYLRSGRWYWVAGLGILAAVGILLKPTYISVGLASALVITYLHLRRRSFKSLLIDLAIMAVAALIPLALVGLYWVLKGDFRELWFAAFTHNLTYVQQGFSLRSLYGTVRMFLIQQPVAAITILVGVAAAVLIYNNWRLIFSMKKPRPDEMDEFTPGTMDREIAHAWYIGGVLLSVIFDAIFLASSGKNFGHYLQVLIPGMVMLMVYLIDVLRRSIGAEQHNRGMQVAVLTAIVVVLLSGGIEIAAKEIPNLQQLKTYLSTRDHFRYQPNELEQYIIDHSSPDDSVLVWAGHPGMNFVTQRRSPTKYIFLLHLFNPTPYSPNGFSEFLDALNADPPELIVTQPVSSIQLPNFEAAQATMCPTCDTGTLEGLLEFKQFVKDNYELSYSIWDWEVYQKKN